MEKTESKFDVLKHCAPFEIHKEKVGTWDESYKYIRVRGTPPGGKFHISDVRFYHRDNPTTDEERQMYERNLIEAQNIALLIVAIPDMHAALLKAREAIKIHFAKGGMESLEPLKQALSDINKILEV